MELYTLACKRCSQWCACPKECHLAQHGPWCSHDIHSRKASIEPSRHFNTSDLSSEATAKLSLINGTLTEEIEVVNAIYGPGTLTVLIADSTRLRLRLELPLGELQATVFWLNFAADYPQTRPSIQQAELTLQQETDRRIQNVFLVLFSLLSSIRERSPCIESLIHESLPIIASLRGHAFDPETATDVAPYADPEEWRWTAQNQIVMGTATELVDCVICCDSYFAFSMARAPCKHYFCRECLASGWEVASLEAEPYACCLKPMPIEDIKVFVTVPEETEWRYKRLLKEKSVQHPFFCGYYKCKELMGDYSQHYLSRGHVKRNGVGPCHSCRRRTCARCREEYHPGPCIPQDDAFEKLAAAGNIRRCPGCGYVWEKNGGCRHVTCPGCYSHWWWKRNGQLEDYALHKHRLHLLEQDEELLDDEGEVYREQEAPELTGEEAARALDRIEAIRAQQAQDVEDAPQAVEGAEPLAEDIDAG